MVPQNESGSGSAHGMMKGTSVRRSIRTFESEQSTEHESSDEGSRIFVNQQFWRLEKERLEKSVDACGWTSGDSKRCLKSV